ncbi:MAG: VanZ family protein, partial [bacterium]
MKKPQYYIPACIVLVMIFGFSAQSGTESGRLSGIITAWILNIIHLPISFAFLQHLIRKAAHMSEFGLLAVSLAFGFKHNDYSRPYLTALLFTFLFACLDETHQLFVDGRAGSFYDVLIDTCGGILLLGFITLLREIYHG